MKTQLAHSFEDIIGVENLLEAWREFARGKRAKRRMVKKIEVSTSEATINSYLGLLKHGNTFGLKFQILKSTSH